MQPGPPFAAALIVLLAATPAAADPSANAADAAVVWRLLDLRLLTATGTPGTALSAYGQFFENTPREVVTDHVLPAYLQTLCRYATLLKGEERYAECVAAIDRLCIAGPREYRMATVMLKAECLVAMAKRADGAEKRALLDQAERVIGEVQW